MALTPSFCCPIDLSGAIGKARDSLVGFRVPRFSERNHRRAEDLQDESIASIQRTASLIRGRAPLAVGFGLSLPSHVRQVIDNGASAAIVGSRFVQIVEQNLDDGHTMLTGLRECAQR